MRSVSITTAIAALAGVVSADSPSSWGTASSIKFSGNGCPQGSATRVGNYDGTFSFSDFVVTNTNPTDKTANCAAHINVNGVSGGWQVAVSAIDAKGHIMLSPGATANFYTTVFWSKDASNSVTVQSTVSNTGSSTIDYPTTIHQTIPSNRLLWSSCTRDNGDFGGILNVNFRPAIVGDPDCKAEVDIYSEKLSYVWRQC